MISFTTDADGICVFLLGLAEWNVPAGGMFLWMKVKGVDDIYEMVMKRGLENHIMCVPGHAFMIDPQQPCAFVRASYSSASEEDINRVSVVID